jgi:hypothetical protein
MSDDIQQDIDDAGEHQMTLEEARRRKELDPNNVWWIKIHDDVVARQRAEMAQAKALDFALRRLFRE